jgi:DNA-binding IclR family transcriptional regulator
MTEPSQADGAGGGAKGPPQPQRHLQSVERAFAVLERLAEQAQSPSELARALDMKWTTAYRTLMSLTEMGYVERHPSTGRYSVGVRTYSLGSAYIASLSLHQVARPYLEAASGVGSATAQLVKRVQRQSVVISVCEVRTDHVPETTVGCNFPLHCGSKGRVLLAYAPPDFVEDYLSQPLEALTPMTITDPAELRTRLENIRARGYEMSDRDIRLFSSSVAAPVTDTDGVVASVTLAVQPHELRKNERRLIELVVRTANGISRAMRDRGDGSFPD